VAPRAGSRAMPTSSRTRVAVAPSRTSCSTAAVASASSGHGAQFEIAAHQAARLARERAVDVGG